MRKFFLLLLVLWLTSERAPAETSLPVVLQTADAARAWQAVGRVNIDGTGFCTGALISERLVLTAAHCLFDKRTGARVADSQVAFLAGWRGGRAEAERHAPAGGSAPRVQLHQQPAA